LKDRLQRGVEHFHDRVEMAISIEEIADLQGFEVLVAVELLVIGIDDRLELCLVRRRQHGHGVAAKVRAGHRDDMRLVARDERGQMGA
jgi:hypothetical protein